MENLKKMRIKRKVTQVKLAEIANVTQETISAYESGKAYPSVETLIKIADFLNTSTDYILDRIENDEPIKNTTIKNTDNKTYRMLSNFIMLNDAKKDDVLWYSEVIRRK